MSNATTAEARGPAARLRHAPPYVFARFDEVLAAKRRAGERVLSLAMGDPDQATFEEIVAAGVAALRDPRNHRYPTNRGRAEFREAVAAFYERRFGVAIDPAREVIPAVGAKECVANLCLGFLDPSSAAIVPDPGYPPYRVGARLAGADVVDLPLAPERGFAPDFAALAPDALERARVLFLNYPNNPTGAVATEEIFTQAVAPAREWGLLLVHDNPYSEVTYDGYRAPSLLATQGARGMAVELFSFSKAYNMAGWRCGALVGDADVLEHYWRLKSNLDQGLFDVVQLAGARALAPDLDARVAERNQRYQARRDMVVDALHRLGCPVSAPLATLYVWAPIPDGYADAAAFCEDVLGRAAVLLTPGSVYGPRGEGWFRVSLGCPEQELGEALRRLAQLDLYWDEREEIPR